MIVELESQGFRGVWGIVDTILLQAITIRSLRRGRPSHAESPGDLSAAHTMKRYSPSRPKKKSQFLPMLLLRELQVKVFQQHRIYFPGSRKARRLWCVDGWEGMKMAINGIAGLLHFVHIKTT